MEDSILGFLRCVESVLSFQLFQNLSRRNRAGGPCQSISGMSARAAQIEILDRRPISCPVQQRTHGENLVERQFAVKDVSTGQAINFFQILRRDDLPAL